MTPCARQRGFTLLELLVTVGVISVLLGIGVGYLGRSSGAPEATSALAGQLRAASLAARSRSLPTEVLIEPGQDGERATVRARGLQPLALYGFEPDERYVDAALTPAIGGEAVEQGRFGAARRPRDGDRAPLLHLPLPPRLADFAAGFALRFDLRLDRRQAVTLLRFGRALEVGLDDQLRPRIRATARGDEGQVGPATNLQASVGLPVGQWCTLEIGGDGSELWCALDGRVLEHTAFRERLHQQQDDQLEVGLGDEPLPGTIDELQLFAYQLASAVELPLDVVPAARYRIQFDAAGEPIAPPRLELDVVAESRKVAFTVGGGGVLQ
jgi:prepilin-type N-terminal cleavage/methylation domain-containing protein